MVDKWKNMNIKKSFNVNVAVLKLDFKKSDQFRSKF